MEILPALDNVKDGNRDLLPSIINAFDHSHNSYYFIKKKIKESPSSFDVYFNNDHGLWVLDVFAITIDQIKITEDEERSPISDRDTLHYILSRTEAFSKKLSSHIQNSNKSLRHEVDRMIFSGLILQNISRKQWSDRFGQIPIEFSYLFFREDLDKQKNLEIIKAAFQTRNGNQLKMYRGVSDSILSYLKSSNHISYFTENQADDFFDFNRGTADESEIFELYPPPDANSFCWYDSFPLEVDVFDDYFGQSWNEEIFHEHLYKKGFDDNDWRVQLLKGKMLELGIRFIKDAKRSFEIYHAISNTFEGEFEIGRCYTEGIGVGIDKGLGHYHLKCASFNFFYLAEHLLVEGNGDNEKKSLRFYCLKKALRHGPYVVAELLGQCYLRGLGTEFDIDEAHKFCFMPYFPTKRSVVEMLVSKFTDLAFKEDCPKAMYYLSDIFGCSEFAKTDGQYARHWLMNSAVRGHPLASWWVSVNYYYGHGTEVDKVASLAWAERAAHLGDINGTEDAGDFYFDGDGVEKNLELAIRYFKLGAEKGSASSQVKLAEMYLNGIGTDRNLEEGYKWMFCAAAGGCPDAQRRLESVEDSGIFESFDSQYMENTQ